jgi:phosphonate transport system substrate-binding protein
VVADKIDINEIRVIANTRWYPGWVYAARAGIDPKIVEKVRKALLTLDVSQEEHQHILEMADFVRVIPSEDQDFNPIRELAARVGISLEK